MNFWFINCPPCRAEIPELNKLVDSFKTNDKVVFIAVALDDKQSLETFLEQSPFNIPSLTTAVSLPAVIPSTCILRT